MFESSGNFVNQLMIDTGAEVPKRRFVRVSDQ